MYQGGMRYVQISTNITEYINAILNDARFLRMTASLDHLRPFHQEWFLKRRTIASTWEIVFLNHEEELMKLMNRKSRKKH